VIIFGIVRDADDIPFGNARKVPQRMFKDSPRIRDFKEVNVLGL
jgi:hypothetical protein